MRRVELPDPVVASLFLTSAVARMRRPPAGNPFVMVAVLIIIVAVNLVLGAYVIGISIHSDRSMRAE